MSVKKNMALNSGTTLFIQVLKIFISFANRKIIIDYLGVVFLGLTGLFGNILNMLSLAELGIGISITYALYKPLAEKNHGKLKSYMALYAKFYHSIGLLILVLGLLMIPILPLFLKGTGLTREVLTIYLLMLASSVLSYFFSYRTSLLTADQKNYQVQLLGLFTYLATTFSQWFILWKTQNVVYYLSVSIILRLCHNVLISYLSHRQINLRKVTPISLTREEKAKLKEDVLGNLVGSIATVIVFQTDNLLISYFASVAVLGLYSNYVMVSNTVTTLFFSAIDTIVPSLGHLISVGRIDKVRKFYSQLTYINYLLFYLTTLGFYALMNDFIGLWLGKSFEIHRFYVFLIAFSLFLTGIRQPNLKLSNAYGLFAKHKLKAVLEALANLIFSLVLAGVFHLDLAGILIGTILSTVLVSSWWEVYIIYKYGFKEKARQHIPVILKQFCVWGIGFLGIHFFQGMYNAPDTVLSFVTKAMATALLLLAIFLVAYVKDDNTKEMLALLKNRLKRRG